MIMLFAVIMRIGRLRGKAGVSRMEEQAIEPLSRQRTMSRRKVRKSGWRKELLDWTKALVIAFVIVMLLRLFIFQLSTVRSYSMQPTLYERDWLFINKIVYQIGDPKRGDIVVLKDPSDGPGQKEFLVKRVVAGPGDTLEIRGSQLYVNGELTLEAYTDSKIEDGDFGPVKVSEGYYFVMGDNRHLNASKDSRVFNEVPRSAIEGRGDFILWPITRWKAL